MDLLKAVTVCRTSLNPTRHSEKSNLFCLKDLRTLLLASDVRLSNLSKMDREVTKDYEIKQNQFSIHVPVFHPTMITTELKRTFICTSIFKLYISTLHCQKLNQTTLLPK